VVGVTQSVHDLDLHEQSRTYEVEIDAPDYEEILRRQKPNVLWRVARALLPALVSFGILFGGWQLIVKIRHLTPVEIVSPTAMVSEVWHNPGIFWSNDWVTLQEAFWGFLIAAVIAGGAAAIVVHSRVMDRAIGPVVAMIQAVPILALGPPLVIWLGHGPATKIIIAALITFSPLYASAVLGFHSIDAGAHEVLRSVNAKRLDVFLRLRLPNSLPYLVSSAKICVPLAIVGAVVGEFVGSYHGLGYMMVQAQDYLNASVVWGSLLVLVLDAVILRGIVSFLGHRLLRWTR
jgi:NitT/TauT family transport system permease protein